VSGSSDFWTLFHRADGSKTLMLNNTCISRMDQLDQLITSLIQLKSCWYPFDEQSCPGHVSVPENPKVCRRCGVHVDSMRPEDEEKDPPVF
jgi:hypothetical protein